MGLRKSAFIGMSPMQAFSKIYQTNFWRGIESISGPGSSLEQTRTTRIELANFLIAKNIKSLLDIPCGDFHWMSMLDLDKVDYIGADIVKELVLQNNRKYKKEKRTFINLDLTIDPLPEVDLIVCRDCLVHLSMEDISSALKNIGSSKSTWVLLTSYSDRPFNFDITSGDWRPLNFLIEPFNFPVPDLIINEDCTEANGIYNDKCLYFYKIKTLQPYLVKYKMSKLRAILHILFGKRL